MEMSAAAPEWRVPVPEGASVSVVEHDAACSWAAARAWAWLAVSSCALAFRDAGVLGFGRRVWRIGADDPRRAVHGLKVGLALTLVSVVYYTRPLYDGVGGTAMWAVLTVVVVFEYTVGGCVYKGFNRAFATASAGVIALGVHWIASKSGDKLQPFISSGSVFVLAAVATFSRFIPTVKARFDYGVTIFILTYSLVAVSGYRVRVGALVALASQRACTVSIGVSLCVAVCALVCPVWAGQELHRATVRNMHSLADAVEAFCCVVKPEAEAADSAKKSIACVLGSRAAEDAQANLARWEPAHGRFAFRHPYAQYRAVGAAVRRCAYCVEALRGCLIRSAESETQAQAAAAAPCVHGKWHLACTRVAARCAAALRAAARCVDTMTAAPRELDLAVAEMSAAVEEMQAELRAVPASSTLLLIGAAAQRMFTVTSLLVEVSVRIEGVVDAVDTLAILASFESAAGDDDENEEPGKNVIKESEENETMKKTIGHWAGLINRIATRIQSIVTSK